jgi:guanylate kinase
VTTDGAHPGGARLTVLSGPSGVGKDSVIEFIRARAPWVWLSVSVTTRQRRETEVDGVHYHFVSRPEFERLIEAGQPVLLKIDLQGARQVRTAMPEAQLVFLAPPSWAELERRLVGRGTDDPQTIRHRLEHALEELAAEPEFDVTVVNHHVGQAAEELLGLLGSHMSDLLT